MKGAFTTQALRPKRYGAGGPVYLTAVIEYMAAEVLEHDEPCGASLGCSAH